MTPAYPEQMLLTLIEARILGSLMEKETTTPEAYPLSLNSLIAAANQKSSREPVMQVTEIEVRAALRLLEDKNLVAVDHGGRVERFENRARTVFHLRRDETTLLCLLLLRGPQTAGELRGRAERLFNFDDSSAVLAALERMGGPVQMHEGDPERPALVAVLPRQPGTREQRFTHLLCGAPTEAVRYERPALDEGEQPAGSRPEVHFASLVEDLRSLQVAVARLDSRLAALEAVLGRSQASSD